MLFYFYEKIAQYVIPVNVVSSSLWVKDISTVSYWIYNFLFILAAVTVCNFIQICHFVMKNNAQSLRATITVPSVLLYLVRMCLDLHHGNVIFLHMWLCMLCAHNILIIYFNIRLWFNKKKYLKYCRYVVFTLRYRCNDSCYNMRCKNTKCYHQVYSLTTPL